MELACALVLLIVGSVTAGPYGYGTKGGATAKADARAVAGAYTGAAGIPLSIPSGAGYSGSFSQSSSSSSSSSSASSSSFSYSGAGAIGGAVPSSGDCSSGNCNSGVASGSQGSAVSQVYGGANAGSLAGGYGGNITPGSYSHEYGNGKVQANKNQDCVSESCQGTNGSNISSESGAGSQSSSAAKAVASAEAGHTAGSNCGGVDCNNIASVGDKCISGKCDSNAKCSSGVCGSSDIGSSPSSFNDSKKCTSGQCEQSRGTGGSSSIDGDTNDINVHTIESAHSKASYGVNKPGCNTGNCGSAPTEASPTVSSNNKPAVDLTAPKLEPLCFGSNCPITPSGYSSSSSKASTSDQNENQLGHVSSNYGGASKPSYIQVSLPSAPVKPTQGAICAPGTPGCGVTAAISSPSAPGYNHPFAPGYDRPSSNSPSYSLGSTPTVNPSSSGCAPGSPGCISFLSSSVSSDCTSGNCGTHHSEMKPSYAHGNSPSTFGINLSGSACSPGSPGCSSTPTTNRPDCALGNCQTYPSGYSSHSSIKPSYSQGSLSSYSFVNPTGPACTPGSPGCPISTSLNGLAGCASGNCGGSPTSTGYSNFGNKPSYSHGASPLNFQSKPLEGSCAPGTPGCGLAPSTTSSSNCASGKCNINPIADGYVNSPNIKPSHSYESSPSQIPLRPVGSPCAPGNPDCSTAPSASGPSDCVSGNCGSYSSGNPKGSACTPGSPGCPTSTSLTGPAGCASGNCAGSPTSSGHSDFGNKPSYSYGASPSNFPLKPFGAGCAPGTPGCGLPPSISSTSNCASGECHTKPIAEGYDSSLNIKPSHSYESSLSHIPLKPVGLPCAPGNPDCSAAPSASGPSDCVSGDCGSYSSGNPKGSACTPGSPGCPTSTSLNGPAGCALGNCGGFPTSTNYSNFGNKPSYSHGASPSNFPLKPFGVGCAPGTPGCGLAPTTSGSSNCASGECNIKPIAEGYDSSLNIKPIHSDESSPSHIPLRPVGSPCAPGNPECSTAPSASVPSDCVFGNCGSYPSAPGYSGSSSTKPYNSQGVPSFSTLIPTPTACASGSPGCVQNPSSGITGCTSGNCGTYLTSADSGSLGIKPSSYGSLSIHGQVKPGGPACIPGTPGCALPLVPKDPSGCKSGNCNEFPPIGGQGGFPNIKPSYTQGSSSYFPVKPSGPGCVPGVPGCGTTYPSSSGQHDAKENLPAYNGGFGGPAGILKPNEYSAVPAPSYGNKPTLSSQGCSPGSPGCSDTPINVHPSATGFSAGHSSAGTSVVQSSGVSSLLNGQTSTGIPVPGYSASGVGSISHNAAFGTHGTGSLQTSFIKPSTGLPSGNGAYAPGISSIPSASTFTPGEGPSPPLGTVGTTAGSSDQHDAKENLPAYNDGFGGPAGILKPNEYSAAPAPSYGNKPTLSSDATTAKPNCVSGTCDTQPSSAHTPSGTALSALAAAEASASANAVAYTGGFGGPPGLLKPYDNGKTDIKGASGLATSLDLTQGVGGSGYLIGGSHVGGSAIAQANTAAVSSAGTSSGDSKSHSGGYSHGYEHGSTRGCGGGCGGTDSGSLGYSSTLNHLKTGVLNDSSSGLAAAGAIAKSVANTSSGARAFGGSYASSSATAHAGASVKGGYGRR